MSGFQPRGQIQFPIQCGSCFERCGWSPTKELSGVALTAFCPKCQKVSAMVAGKKTKKEFMKAQLAWPFPTSEKPL